MAQIILTVEDDTAPAITLNLTRKPDDDAIDLTDASSVSVIIRSSAGTITNTGHQTATISSPNTLGQIVYARQTGDFPSEGAYEAEARITWDDATVETVYEKLEVEARKRLDT